MRLTDLLKSTEYEILHMPESLLPENIDIGGIAYDSRKVTEGGIFVCIDGTVVDGHKYIPQAVAAGAAAVLVQRDIDVTEDIAVIKVEDTRKSLAEVSCEFYGNPSKTFPVVGITGTKGKTSTAGMTKAILDKAGKSAGLIGTIETVVGNERTEAKRTTPESLELQEMFSRMIECGNKSAVMEVSSQGLMLSRVYGTHFDIGVFTNIEKDHIGPNEHSSFEEYFEWKKQLFSMCRVALINADDKNAQSVIDSCKCTYKTYGIVEKAPEYVCSPAPDYAAYNIVTHPNAIEFDVTTPEWTDHVVLNVPGRFNVSNALAAIGIASLRGVSCAVIKEALAEFSVKGRTEIVETNDKFTIMIDYAHNAMSLESLLNSVREYAKGRIVCLFGCGGDRDPSRRPEMGKVSGRLADFTIVTSDNPRTEEPEKIIADIVKGVQPTGGEFVTIINRTDAIRYAIENAQQDDIIVLAGKGHETYQIFSDKTIHYDEREVVNEIMKDYIEHK